MISAVFVSYRSAALASRAIATFREDARRAGLDAEAIAVVNSEDPAERDALLAHADAVVFPPHNLGFAGGLNAGIAAARGELLFLANPDLEFREGSVAALAEALRCGGPVAAGPALFADAGRTVLLPSAEEGRPEDLARKALALDPERGARVFRRDARRAVARAEHARERRTAAARGLSGALVAVTHATLESVGPFDEAYPLYYEENDWQRRLVAAGGRMFFVGGAHVVHLFGQSTRREPRSVEWFIESEARYYDRHFGAAGRRALARLGALPPWHGPMPPRAAGVSWTDDRPVAVAVSPFPWFRPIALALVGAGQREFRLPEDLLRAHEGEPLFLRAFVRGTGEVLAEAQVSGS